MKMKSLLGYTLSDVESNGHHVTLRFKKENHYDMIVEFDPIGGEPHIWINGDLVKDEGVWTDEEDQIFGDKYHVKPRN
jgi:hypothetical protein